MWLEISKRRERTDFRIGTTTSERRESRRLADLRYHQRMNEIAARRYKLPGSQPQVRFATYAGLYGDAIQLHKGAQREAEMLKHLIAFFGDDVLDDIDVERVRAYMGQRKSSTFRGRPISASTINREIDLLKAMLREAVPKYLNESPIAGLKRLRVVTPRRRLMMPDEEQKLLEVCQDAQDRAIIILGVDTLLRLGNLVGLKRSDRHGSWLYVADTKNGTPVEVPLSPRAAAALDAVTDEGPHFFAKFRRAENPRDWTGSVRQRLEHLCTKAKLPYGRDKGGLTFHWATRRTGATRLLVQRGVSVPVVQRLGNWQKPDVLLEIYAEAQKDDLLRAVGAASEGDVL
jgi:integrase